MSISEIVFFLLDLVINFCLAPASSTTSIALSGKKRSFICFEDREAADLNAP